MSLAKYQQARELIESLGNGDFEGAKPESLVIKAEPALNLKFPTSYRRFLLEMGCGDFNGFEVFGIINDNFENSTVPNGIWITLNERQNIGLDPRLIIIGEGGDGSYVGIDTVVVTSEGEFPVVRISIEGKREGKIADSFGQYLLQAVSDVI